MAGRALLISAETSVGAFHAAFESLLMKEAELEYFVHSLLFVSLLVVGGDTYDGRLVGHGTGYLGSGCK